MCSLLVRSKEETPPHRHRWGGVENYISPTSDSANDNILDYSLKDQTISETSTVIAAMANGGLMNEPSMDQ